MSGPFGSSQWMYSSGFYPTELEQSLRFNDDDSAYLSRTPASVGNRKTWTWSGWVKLGTFAQDFNLISARTGISAPLGFLRIQSATNGYALNYGARNSSNVIIADISTNALFRDPSAWYHIVVALDTEQATASDRYKVYVNGVLQSLTTSTAVTLNSEGSINGIYEHNIGKQAASAVYADGYLSEVNFIDGQALDPTSFGEFKSGVWVAKSYAGSYGTNGFYLPFNDPNFIGKDYSTVLGSELITNGTFDTDLTGWSDYHGESNIAQEDGRLKVFRDTRTFPKAVQTISTTIGADYVATLTYIGGTHNGDIGLEIVDSGGSIGDLTLTPTNGTQYQVKFTATETTTTIRIAVYSITNAGEYSLFDDVSVREIITQGNDWTANNLVATDVVPDSPTNNFAVLNAIGGGISETLSEGNLSVTTTNEGNTTATIAATSGKWYWEGRLRSNAYYAVGLTNEAGAASTTSMAISGSNSVGYWAGGGIYDQGGLVATVASYTTSDVVAAALDMDVGNIKFYKNNTLIYTYTFGSSGAGVTFPVAFPAVNGGGTSGRAADLNFGQDSSFAGNKTAQGNTDDNGVGDFYYSPPSGYLALCTANLPDPAIDPAQDDVPADYFNTVLYSGNSSTQSITVGFQPDFVWTKERNIDRNHDLFNAISGAGYYLESNTTDAEVLAANSLTSFDADGFTLGSSTGVNFSGRTYVAWNWLAGNGTSSNTSGSITSTVSVNQKAGFSVVSWTGDGTEADIGHGLGANPDLIILKDRDAAVNWLVYHSSNGENKYLKLNDTTASSGLAGQNLFAGNTSTTFGVGSGYSSNTSGNDYIAYCFAEVEGYSKFGSYTGNGSTDGPFVYTGFRPAFIMTKRTDSTGSWEMYDAKRIGYNAANYYIYAQASNAEATDVPFDILSNGFKRRSTGGSANASGGTYIYMAFAETPFKYANAR